MSKSAALEVFFAKICDDALRLVVNKHRELLKADRAKCDSVCAAMKFEGIRAANKILDLIGANPSMSQQELAQLGQTAILDIALAGNNVIDFEI